jgi:glycosyltransferase involved in cell wall biosynthesis
LNRRRSIIYIGDIDNDKQRENYGIINHLEKIGFNIEIFTFKHPKLPENIIEENKYCQLTAQQIYEIINLKKIDYEMIFTLFFGLDLLISIYLKERIHLPVVTIAMASQVYRRTTEDIQFKLNKIDKVIASTNLINTYIQKINKNENLSIKTIYLGINYDLFSKKKYTKEYFAVNFTRFVPKKGIQMFLQIAKEYFNIDPNKKFLLIGDGPELNEIVDFIDNNELKNVILKSFLPYEEIPKFVGKSKIALFTFKKIKLEKKSNEFFQYDMEGIPFSIMEAMASSVPVISSNNGAINEIICNYKTGILIDKNLLEIYIKTIKKLIKNKELYYRLQKTAKKYIEKNFNQKIQMNKIVNFIFET